MIRQRIFYITSTLVVLLLLGSAFTPKDRYFEIAKNLDIFATLFKEVNTWYVDDVPPSKLIKTGIDAMLSSLDPYTNYISEDQIEDYRTLTTGEYSGIGASVGSRGGRTLILMPLAGFAADRAGLKIGDEILKIDDIPLEGKSYEAISKLIKGETNTDIKLSISRYGEEKPLEITITREKIQTYNVPYKGMVTDDIGLIRLVDFRAKASEEVKNALDELKAKGAKKIILDLRGNPGGLLDEAIKISNIFVDKGKEIVSTKGKVEEWNKNYKAQFEAVDSTIPLAILTSSTSASASEIVAGVMQDYDRGVLIGENTYGKGLVQATRPLSYNSQLKVTIAKYYIPSGRCIQAIDYSNRNADGSVGKIPDSLRTKFKTQGGRVVYDGGGVKPDIVVNHEQMAPITRSLLSKGLIFDYANKYRFDHQKIIDADKFSLSDAAYTDFVKWLASKDYDYTTRVESVLTGLEKVSKEEESYKLIASNIKDLKEAIANSKKNDLITFKEQIREALELEVAMRYYLEKGAVEATFDDDLDIIKAVEVLNDSKAYKALLKQ